METSSFMPAWLPAVQLIQRKRVQTALNGSYTWVFDTPYDVGVIPTIALTVENSDANSVWNHNIISVNNTQVVVQLTKTTDITILATIHVLGIAANPQAFIHLLAAG